MVTIGGATGTSAAIINNGVKLTIAPNTCLTVQDGLTLSGTGTLDLANNGMIVHNGILETATTARLDHL